MSVSNIVGVSRKYEKNISFESKRAAFNQDLLNFLQVSVSVFWVCVCVRERERVCAPLFLLSVCEREIDRERESEYWVCVCVCVCERERECMCVWERESVWVCVCEAIVLSTCWSFFSRVKRRWRKAWNSFSCVAEGEKKTLNLINFLWHFFSTQTKTVHETIFTPTPSLVSFFSVMFRVLETSLWILWPFFSIQVTNCHNHETGLKPGLFNWRNNPLNKNLQQKKVCVLWCCVHFYIFLELANAKRRQIFLQQHLHLTSFADVVFDKSGT